MASPILPRLDGAGDSVAMIAKWIRRCGLPFAILGWTGVALLLLWLAGHILQTLLLLTIAALLAYALSPVVKLLTRMMPRVLAILMVYLVILGALSALLYLIVSTAIVQFRSLAGYVQVLLTPGTHGQLTPFEQTARSLGISPAQIASARDQLVRSIEGFAGSIVPLLTGLVGALLDVILVAVLSIYFLAGGSRVFDWLRANMPTRQQGRMKLLLDTLQRVVGGYLRGQLILCAFVGLLVGVGMEVIAWNRSPRPDAGVPMVELDDLLGRADVISLHLALNDQTRGLLDQKRLARTKPGVILINTARGALVDEPALIDALERGHIRHAGLDVFHAEPLKPDHPLARMQNVTLTSHAAFRTLEASMTLMRRAIEIVRRIVTPPPGLGPVP